MANYYTELTMFLPMPKEEADWIIRLDRALSETPGADGLPLYPSNGAPPDPPGEDLQPAMDALKAYMKTVRGDDDLWPSGCSLRYMASYYTGGTSQSGLFIESQEVDLDALTGILQQYQRRFNIHEPIAFGYAFTCDKARPDGFGGGATVVLPTEVREHTTGSWIAEQLVDLCGPPTNVWGVSDYHCDACNESWSVRQIAAGPDRCTGCGREIQPEPSDSP